MKMESKPKSTSSRLELDSRPRSLSQEIVGVLERAIIAGTYEPGQRLVERELTAQFGVSSIPVREALQELENRGLITKRHNYGCAVVQLTPEEAEQICRLRRALEPDVLRWAIERITSEDVAALEEICGAMAKAAESGDFPEFVQMDMQFHKTLWAISGNKYAAKALESALAPLFAAGLPGAKASKKLVLLEEVKKHKKLVAALADKDVNGAGQALLAITSGFEKQFRR